MTTRNRRTLSIFLPLLAAGLLFIGWKTAPVTNTSTETAETSSSAGRAAVEMGASTTSNACRYDPSKAINVPAEELVSFQDPMLGNPDAEVTVVEFFDPNCIHCQSFHPIMKQVIAEYEDRVRFYMKPFALWPYSINQVEAMILAARHGKYYEMVDLQMAQGITSGMSTEQIVALADSLNLDTESFAEALRSDEVRDRVIHYAKQAQAFGITSTPTLIIEGKVVAAESRTVNCISQLIDAQLAD